ncbi:MAG: hypothetical protein JXR22_01705 [Prolixibacteraceae bacterium]|nr:hypothetical protein [Prolixibacteraceae bacterium]
MDIQTNIANPFFYLLLIIAAIVALIWLLYFNRKQNDEFTKIQRNILSILKFIAVWLIAVLLLSPVIETIQKKTEKPIIILGIDNSESMAVDASNPTFIAELIETAKNELSDQYQVDVLTFGEGVNKTETPVFDEKKSNYAQFISELNKQYYNLNVGAVIITGDGIFNEGTNPSQVESRIGAPFYTLGLGDTLIKTDQAIVDVTHNPNVFLNNTFPIDAAFNFTNFPQSQTQLAIYIEGKLLHSETIEVLQPDFFFRKTYQLLADEPGLKRVELVLSPFTEEHNLQNNRFRFTIEVHDNKQEILILSQGPHPDIGAMTQTLNDLANFNITYTDVLAFSGDFSKYDLLILNQLPSMRTQHLAIFEKIANSEKAVMVLVGPGTSIAGLNNMQLHFQLNPTLLSQESTPYFNETFALFSIPENIHDVEKIYPPLLAHFTEYTYDDGFSVLAYQQVNGIELNHPLIMAGDINNRKIGAIMGEGIWRWRFYEYQNYNNQLVFNQLITNLVNYLCLKEVREQFRIYYERIATETSPIKMKAQVFNNIYELVENAEIQLTLSDSSGNELGYLFDANQMEYTLNMGFLRAGTYTFNAQTTLGESVFTRSGSFSVEEVNIEQHNSYANYNVLNLIARQTGGQFFLKEQRDELISQIKSNEQIQPKIHLEKNINEVIDWKWIMLLVVMLSALEWFLRKFWGSY